MASIARQLLGTAHSCRQLSRHVLRQQLPTVQTVRLCKNKAIKFERFDVDTDRAAAGEFISHPLIYDVADPGPLFLDHRVQHILKFVTGCDHAKLFRSRKLRKKAVEPSYQFMTDKQLQEVRDKADAKAVELLRMPPVLKVRTEDTVVISKDPALEGLSSLRLVITDISPDVPDTHRLIVVREPDGTLRHAHPDERHRMIQIFNPLSGRDINMPQIFREGHLKSALSRGECKFVMDRACIQMDPDNSTYQSAMAYAYESIDNTRSYDTILSTRHYGPMVFFLVWHNRMDFILEDCINKQRIIEAGQMVNLHMLLHPDSKTADVGKGLEDPLELVQAFLTSESKHRGSLELAVTKHLDLERNRAEFAARVTSVNANE